MHRRTTKSFLPIASGLLGLALTLALVALIAWQAIRADGQAPSVAVETGRILADGSGYRVEFTARNLSPNTAADVQIEGTLHDVADEPVISQVGIGYLPGNSERKGGLFFPADPRSGRLEVRALGYRDP